MYYRSATVAESRQVSGQPATDGYASASTGCPPVFTEWQNPNGQSTAHFDDSISHLRKPAVWCSILDYISGWKLFLDIKYCIQHKYTEIWLPHMRARYICFLSQTNSALKNISAVRAPNLVKIGEKFCPIAYRWRNRKFCYTGSWSPCTGTA